MHLLIDAFIQGIGGRVTRDSVRGANSSNTSRILILSNSVLRSTSLSDSRGSQSKEPKLSKSKSLSIPFISRDRGEEDIVICTGTESTPNAGAGTPTDSGGPEAGTESTPNAGAGTPTDSGGPEAGTESTPNAGAGTPTDSGGPEAGPESTPNAGAGTPTKSGGPRPDAERRPGASLGTPTLESCAEANKSHSERKDSSSEHP
ncbi:hypothetical protein M8J75_000938 [Diaphorina citri]|nr:hypothetical protein M8J75_000938 [Diaphorina citri]